MWCTSSRHIVKYTVRHSHISDRERSRYHAREYRSLSQTHTRAISSHTHRRPHSVHLSSHWIDTSCTAAVRVVETWYAASLSLSRQRRLSQEYSRTLTLAHHVADGAEVQDIAVQTFDASEVATVLKLYLHRQPAPLLNFDTTKQLISTYRTSYYAIRCSRVILILIINIDSLNLSISRE